jgi:DNA-binding MarR family transcriptional regulator
MKNSLKALTGVIELLRDAYPDASLNVFLLYILVCQAGKDGISMQDLEKRMDLSQAAISRNVAILTDTNYNREEGMGLVTRVEDPMNRRSKLVSLSSRGARFMAQMKQALE